MSAHMRALRTGATVYHSSTPRCARCSRSPQTSLNLQFVPPPLERSTIFLPFDAFKLVRGPRLVPGVPPLSAEGANATFQMSIILSKFLISADGAALDGFKEGRFTLRTYMRS